MREGDNLQERNKSIRGNTNNRVSMASIEIDSNCTKKLQKKTKQKYLLDINYLK